MTLSHEIEDVYHLFQYLQDNCTGRDIDILNIQHFINIQFDNLKEFYAQIITKDLKVGISADTINKVFGKDFIPTFSVMLAKKYSEHMDKVKGNFVLTQKLDGCRLVIIKDSGVVKSFTRQGNQYEGLEDIESEIASIPIDNIVFDGELIADCDGTTHEVYTETTSKARSKGKHKQNLLFHIFDMLSLKDFQHGKSRDNCIERKNNLSNLFSLHEFNFCKEVKPLYIGNDIFQIKTWHDYANKQGWEGVMVNLDTPYVCKRTDTILKVKAMQTCDLKVIDVEEGDGRNKGKLGALIVDYKGNRLGVGSGFTDDDRVDIWNNKGSVTGKIVEIQYFEESKNSDGIMSLRFPVFVKWRDDKTEPSYN